ncbi:hypothetical protein HY772_03470 [Candidatus Woesearchaeota archaeon]|nr:hypothetical protein [Candidatus Woesearchaeota archaeon]
MKALRIIFFSIGLIGFLNLAFAGVAGSKHDMYSLGKGQDQNVCNYCHIPHNAAGEKIWSTWANEAQLASGPSTTIGNMCYTCHDGTATNIGQSTAFNNSLQQHKITSGQDCNMCHSVHDNTNGMFMVIPKTESASSVYSPTYCETCHDATMYPGAEHLGDHLAGTEHKYKYIGGSCNTCHWVHGAANYTTGGLTNPILRMDNSNGALCNLCHYALYYPGYVQGPGGVKHPANLATPGRWGNVNCETCHDPHQPDIPAGRAAILRQDNIDSSYCTYCHNATDETNGPKIGNSHPVNVGFSMTPADPALTPAGNAIDDDDGEINAIDYPANSSDMICESCHSVHRKGAAVPLLRITKDSGSLCINCHSDK